MLLYGPNTRDSESGLGAGREPLPASGVVRFIVPSLPFFAGEYLFSASVYDSTLNIAYDHHDQMYRFRVEDAGPREFGCVRIESRWEVEQA
jgi:hypothetical protein